MTSTTISSGSVRRWLTYSLLVGALLLVWLMSMARPASAAPGQVISDEHAHVTNAGTAVATSGQNNTVGNSSKNLASNDQRAGGRGVSYNSATTRNTSTGTSNTTTGSANAVGNSSTTTVDQWVNANGFDGLALIRQNFDATNIGRGEAISGMNTATGNGSVNVARSSQGAFTSGSTAVNNASSTSGSDGLAAIVTGDATATGNMATTNGTQIANATPGAASGIALIDQTADVAARGSAAAVTGGNTASGNASFNLASAVQGAVSARGPPVPVATNQSASTNSSNGTSNITTGAATATGSNTYTSITQEDEASSKLPNVVDSSATVSNRGAANATSGVNRAVGNISSNTSTNSQGASGGGPAVNTASVDNHSNGSAWITTGSSDATGNIADTTDADVSNRGTATATSGRNRAAGNASGNTADNRQSASGGRVANNTATVLNHSDGTAAITTGSSKAVGNDAISDGGGTIVNRGFATAVSGANDALGNSSGNTAFNGQFALGGVAVNQANADNHSTGTARVSTGAADAAGNRATTTVSQEDEGSDDPVTDISQDIVVINRGSAVAVSGANRATGNASVNDAETSQRAFGVRVAANTGNTVSHSDGIASIHTGSATAIGNSAKTTVDQTALTSEPFALVGQTITVRNVGDATAASGRNVGTGNGSVNFGLNRQLAGAVAAVHSNSAPAENNSTGAVDIDTGSAYALGNWTANNASQDTKSTGAAA